MDKHGEQSTWGDAEARFNFPQKSPRQHPSVSADLLSPSLQRPTSPFALPSPPPLTLLHQLLGLFPASPPSSLHLLLPKTNTFLHCWETCFWTHFCFLSFLTVTNHTWAFLISLQPPPPRQSPPTTLLHQLSPDFTLPKHQYLPGWQSNNFLQ